ncbi:hypothetical protein Mal15_58770 [Stieleria maiorica]|uniref:Uncharacterized protein n=1 Tax=Stieleria maiorica TaxID=2795974 RepID=A0A5B9MQ16_9BACT|nr:hypothetical protein [Stieleria maiorica]QEG01796.1 hypothetical protein Mal15_58770 [Stieleria maiorica]
MPVQNSVTSARRGSTYLEVQVAMVLLSIGISGLYSLSVVQSRQTAQLQQMLPADQIASINPVTAGSPAEAAWAKKFGVYADIVPDAVAAPSPIYPLNSGYQAIRDNEDSSGFTTHAATGGDDWEEYGGHPGDNESTVHEIQTTAAYGSYALFSFYSVPPGDYELFTYVPEKKSSYAGEFGSAVPHHVYCDGLVGTVHVDQRSLKHDLERSGRWWESLGTYTFTHSTVHVLIYDTPVSGDWLIADAVMLRCRRSVEIVTPALATPDGGATVTVELD